MNIFTGKGVYPAVAIGKVKLIGKHRQEIKRITVADTDIELQRLENARNFAVSQLREIYEKALDSVGEESARVFEIHIMMLEDEDYNDSITEMIKSENVNAEFAVSMTCAAFSQMFSEMDDAYMQARSADIRDISDRLIACLTGEDKKICDSDDKVIICADDILPSEAILFDREKISAFVTAYGTSSSHTAILARNLGIPAVISVGKDFLCQLQENEIAIADGINGEFITNPDENTLAAALEKQNRQIRRKELLKALKGKENITADGRKISIFANIQNADEAETVLENDAGGIGLFRSEFIYLDSDTYPTEQQQFAIYKRVLELMGNKKVIIRTLDIGADKTTEYFGLKKEENPVLGMRAIRISLTRPELFMTQLKALFRASAYGNLAIMFPMITSPDEVTRLFELCDRVKNELKSDGIPYNENTEIGIMIETPAAAIISDILAPMVDFFSIGTNDLTQYMLACDRQNSEVVSFCLTHHPAIMRVINECTQNAHKYGKWIGICGELASDLTLTEEFIRMGIDELSVAPSSVLPLREKVRSLRIDNGGSTGSDSDSRDSDNY